MRQSPLYAAWRSPVTSISVSNLVAVHCKSCSRALRKTKAFDSCDSTIPKTRSGCLLDVVHRLHFNLNSFHPWSMHGHPASLHSPSHLQGQLWSTGLQGWNSSVSSSVFMFGLGLCILVLEWKNRLPISCSLWSLVLSTSPAFIQSNWEIFAHLSLLCLMIISYMSEPCPLHASAQAAIAKCNKAKTMKTTTMARPRRLYLFTCWKMLEHGCESRNSLRFSFISNIATDSWIHEAETR